MQDSEFLIFSCKVYKLNSSSYGPSGELIILPTLHRMYNDTLSTLLASTLQDLFHSQPGNSCHHFWDGADFITSPIHPRDFFEYILLPETAALLIAEDLNITRAEAYGIWIRSKDYGAAFNSSTDDGTIDDLNNENIKAQVLFVLLFLISNLNSHFSMSFRVEVRCLASKGRGPCSPYRFPIGSVAHADILDKVFPDSKRDSWAWTSDRCRTDLALAPSSRQKKEENG